MAVGCEGEIKKRKEEQGDVWTSAMTPVTIDVARGGFGCANGIREQGKSRGRKDRRAKMRLRR